MATAILVTMTTEEKTSLWHAVIFGVLLAFGFWLLESILHLVLFVNGSWMEAFFPLDANELWMRGVVAVVLFAAGLIGAVLLERYRQAVKALTIDQRALSELSESVVISNAKNEIVFVNPAYTQVTGYSAEEVLGKNPNVASSGQHDKSFYQAMWARLKQTGHWQGEVMNRHKDGQLYPEWLSINVINGADRQAEFFIGIFTDITERKKSENVIKHYAFYDTLTNMPNRRFFYERLKQAILYAQRSHTKLAVIYIDMDHFKTINDTYGHDVGDHYLCAYAQAIKSKLRSVDTLSRFGGDEFVVLLISINDANDALTVANKILAIKEVSVNKQSLEVSSSMGVALYPDHAKDADELIKLADKAMYKVKHASRGSIKLSGDA